MKGPLEAKPISTSKSKDQSARAFSKISCVSCHPQGLSSSSLPFTYPPTCQPCHTNQMIWESPLPSASSLIDSHQMGHWKNQRQHIPIRFNHNLHQKYDLKCTECHTETAHSLSESISSLNHNQAGQRGQQCVECHQKKQVDTQCALCHPERQRGRLKTNWGSSLPQLKPMSFHGGVSHTLNFLTDHAQLASHTLTQCTQCHSASFCSDCHNPTSRNASMALISTHGPGYIQRHGSELRFGQDEQHCTQCHEPQRSCAPCHQRSQIHSRAGELSFTQVSRQKRAFHPLNYAQGQHAFEAKRSLSQCQSCHSESDCLTCHQSLTHLLTDQASPLLKSPHSTPPCILPKRASDLSCQQCHQGQTKDQLCRP